MNEKTFKIREATINDWSDISALSNQLGYSNSQSDIKKQLSSLIDSNTDKVYVVFLPEGNVVAWIHVTIAQRLESGTFAEIGGFIVSEEYRNMGMGKRLLRAAEKWTAKMGLQKLRVRSNIKRKDAAVFYSHMGFSISKNQSVFDKTVKMEF